MNRNVFRLVLLVSMAHAMVHVYELSLPSVETKIGEEFKVGPETTGPLGTAWRITFGAGALLAGWLADRFGSKPMLLVYLVGCAATSTLAWYVDTLDALFVVMFSMGCFASIYHPAGLSIISRQTTSENRAAALGWHGIFGSIGIASAPLIAGVTISSLGLDWRQYFLLLTAPGLILALLLWKVLDEPPRKPPARDPSNNEPARYSDWTPYLITVSSGVLTGVVYSALMHFLTRYLSGGETPAIVNWAFGAVRRIGTGEQSAVHVPVAEVASYGAATALVIGAFGQGIAGRLARPKRLHLMYVLILLGQVPCLLWMSMAEGEMRLWAACAMALVHFMSQPVYNSMIARYVPDHRRSVGYGFSNMMIFGLGAIGPTLAGYLESDRATYATLALFALVASLAALALQLRHGRAGKE